MTLCFLAYFWRTTNLSRFSTISGQDVEVIEKGTLQKATTFSNACIYTQDLYWAGSIDIAISISDWQKKQQQKSPNTVLLLVWHQDKAISTICNAVVVVVKDHIQSQCFNRCSVADFLRKSITVSSEFSPKLVLKSKQSSVFIRPFSRKKRIIQTYTSLYNQDYRVVLWLLLFQNGTSADLADFFTAFSTAICTHTLLDFFRQKHCFLSYLKDKMEQELSFFYHRFSYCQQASIWVFIKQMVFLYKDIVGFTSVSVFTIDSNILQLSLIKHGFSPIQIYGLIVEVFIPLQMHTTGITIALEKELLELLDTVCGVGSLELPH